MYTMEELAEMCFTDNIGIPFVNEASDNEFKLLEKYYYEDSTDGFYTVDGETACYMILLMNEAER